MGTNHKVVQGECLSSLAKTYGFRHYTTIYDHPDNAELKQNRSNPNILSPGDNVFIPDHDIKTVGRATNQRHRFVVKRAYTLLRLVILDSSDTPFANLPYDLKISGSVLEGMTDGGGRLEEEIPADAEQGIVILYSGAAKTEVDAIIPFAFGHLDPVEEITGIQSRLTNLGFRCGKIDGILGPKTRAALAAFQRKHELSDTGEADPATRSKLTQIHDWQ